jgi:hypothetical protein
MSRALYREPDFDDSVCCGCGQKLPETVAPFSWADNGWHHLGCALRFGGALEVRGTEPSTELARVGGGAGPGFEESLVRAWREKLAPGEQLAIRKLRSENDPTPSPGAWAWRLYRISEGGAFAPECLAFRLTPRRQHDCDEECIGRACVACYLTTGETVCRRNCAHRDEDDEDAGACLDCERSYGPGATCRCEED